MKFLIFLFAIIALTLNAAVINPCRPQQIHTALSDAYTSTATRNSSPLKIIFHTSEECPGAFLEVITPNGVIPVHATNNNRFAAKYYGLQYLTFVHIFDLPPLEFNQEYHYACFADARRSEPIGPIPFYLTSPYYSNKPTTVLLYGDMDYSEKTYPMVDTIINLADKNFSKIAAVIHYGDLAYNLERDGGKKGDDFMNGIQPIAATLPYMIVPGNHEVRGNFSNVNMRFRMPNYEATKNHLFSYNVGNIHFVHFSFDLLSLHPELLSVTTDFLIKDLKEANANRANHPWIIATSHRPIWLDGSPAFEGRKFDTSKHAKGCIPECDVSPKIYAAIEKILYENKVDMYFAGHIHHYERMLPLYNGKVMKHTKLEGDANSHYIINPQAPVHILQGSPVAGGLVDNIKSLNKGRGVRKGSASSFAAVHAINSTHLHFENMLSNSGKVNDFMYLIKDAPTTQKIHL